MARGEAALLKLQSAFFRADWEEVLRLSKKYLRHREIDEHLSNGLQALALFFLSRDRYLAQVPFQSNFLLSSLGGCELEFPWLPTELLSECTGSLKATLKATSCRAQPARIASGLFYLYNVDAGIPIQQLPPVLDPKQFLVMKDLFDFFCWLQVYVQSITHHKIDLLASVIKDLENIESSLSPPLKELYNDAMLKYSLTLSHSEPAKCISSLRKYLWLTNSQRAGFRLVAMRMILDILEQRFSDASYKRDIGDLPFIPLTQWQPASLVEDSLLLSVTFVQEYCNSRPLTKNDVQLGWLVIKKHIIPKILQTARLDVLEFILESTYASFSVDSEFYELLFVCKRGLQNWLEATLIARQIATPASDRFLRIHLAPPSELADEVALKKLFVAEPLVPLVSECIFYALTRGGEDKNKEAWDLWDSLTGGSVPPSPFVIKAAVDLAYSSGNRPNLDAVVSRCRSIVSSLLESAPHSSLSPTISPSFNNVGDQRSDSRLPPYLQSDGDAASVRSKSSQGNTVHSMGGFSLQAGEYRPVLSSKSSDSSKYPSIEEWKEKYYPMSPADYRCLKRFGICCTMVSVEEFEPLFSTMVLQLHPHHLQHMLLALCWCLYRQSGPANLDELTTRLQHAFQLDPLEPLVHLLRFAASNHQADADFYQLCAQKTGTIEDIDQEFQGLLHGEYEIKLRILNAHS
jgi:hypothetical protein